ncbi:hypothetical protein O0L34_g15991 [Tuta absoluta]|nr:hypothetical protein O0L34_g15991 [Tuta absoluta]
MATKKIVPKAKNKLLATLVTGKREPCAFCKRDTDDEAIFGKLYAIGDIHVHYFCALLSCCLVQKGKDTEGLFGFLYPDIVAEVERSKKHKCSYCGMGGASLGCSVSACRKQFHLPCGREKKAVSLFFGNYKSFCQLHAPRQKIPEHIMTKARIRMKQAKGALRPQNNKRLPDGSADKSLEEQDDSMVCVICYELVEAYPCCNSFWPPCCARDAWFHSTCLQAMALSAGMHYLKCPLCNDKERFLDAVVSQGYYVPDRDAAWELETNAFREIYERAHPCSANTCSCPEGRSHDTEAG